MTDKTNDKLHEHFKKEARIFVKKVVFDISNHTVTLEGKLWVESPLQADNLVFKNEFTKTFPQEHEVSKRLNACLLEMIGEEAQ